MISAVSDVRLTIIVRVSEFTGDNVAAVELAQLEILIYVSNEIIKRVLKQLDTTASGLYFFISACLSLSGFVVCR